jgi:hypothetical protein
MSNSDDFEGPLESDEAGILLFLVSAVIEELLPVPVTNFEV